MPRTATSPFWTYDTPPSEFREAADFWERIAASADADGDTHHASMARNNAAALRQRAREIECRPAGCGKGVGG